MLKNKRSYLIPIVGFFIIIVISSIILYLPICNINEISFRDILFTATSAITTTGLTRGNVTEQFSFLGQLIIAILMEIGALGFIIFFSYFWSIKNKKIKMSDIIVIDDNISDDNYSLIREHSVFIVKFMLRVQVVGSIFLMFKFIPEYGVICGIWTSILLTISAFSNSGFDFSSYNGLTKYSDSNYLQIVLILIMFIGSIGIFVIEDIKNNKSRRFSKLKLQSKIVIIYTLVLVIIPTILIKLYEPNMSIINSLFLTVSSRSTGFTITDLSQFTFGSKVLLIILMMIGGSPTSTAGGIKIVTLAIVISTIISTLEGKNETVMFWRKIPNSIVRKAFTILMLFLICLLVACLLFGYFNNIGAMNIVFESASAISNSGLSITEYTNINIVGQTILIVLMFIGRVGPMSMLLIFVNEDRKNKFIEYPEENVML